jgi:N-acetylmuramoyl-L-alanine amidase
MKQRSIIIRYFIATAVAMLLLWPQLSYGQPADAPIVSRVEVQSGKHIDRVVLHISQAISYDSFVLANPARIVIDMPVLDWNADQGLPLGYKNGILKNVRVARFNPTTMRMVFDLAQSAQLDEVSVKNQGGNKPFLMIFDVVTPQYEAGSKDQEDTETPHWQKEAPTPASIRNSTGALAPLVKPDDWGQLVERSMEPKPIPADLPFHTIPVPVLKSAPKHKPVVVIDAGHGGRDPGATGVKGTREKYVTLEYAKALAEALRATGRYEVALTREDDTYIMLRERLAMGRRAKGDIFISVHADSAENHTTRGLSIYTLSENASDKEAAALAARENKVDIIYGMNLSSETRDVTEILIDLAQRETKNKSSRLADILVEAVSKKVKLLPNTHRYAGFAVLKAPDVPSVLIELGFLSNRKDEALIISSTYRQGVVQALVDGIDNYFTLQNGR